MKALYALIKIFIYSNLFVSFCVTAFTHLTYIIYDLPTDNLVTILLMVFSFTFFTYNGQRIIKFRRLSIKKDLLNDRVAWILKHRKLLILLTILSGITGLVCTYYMNIVCWYILIPMGAFSFFYVIPLFPFYKKSPTLREIPFLKIFVIALVWSLVVVGLPFFEISKQGEFYNLTHLTSIAMFASPVFFFIIGITIPFDIRDISYDNNDKLKTIPNAFGIRPSIIIAEVCLLISILLLYTLVSELNVFIGLMLAHLIAMVMIWFSGEKRKELFYSGWIEGSVLLLYLGVIISEYCLYL